MQCPSCHNLDQESIGHSEQWDAFYCKRCNCWIEGKCSDPKCYFKCRERPDFPFATLPRNSMDESQLFRLIF